MQYGIGLPNQIRNVDPTVIPAWARRAESAGFSSLATVGRIAYPGVRIPWLLPPLPQPRAGSA
jgi:hypothetical protein